MCLNSWDPFLFRDSTRQYLLVLRYKENYRSLAILNCLYISYTIGPNFERIGTMFGIKISLAYDSVKFVDDLYLVNIFKMYKVEKTSF